MLEEAARRIAFTPSPAVSRRKPQQVSSVRNRAAFWVGGAEDSVGPG